MLSSYLAPTQYGSSADLYKCPGGREELMELATLEYLHEVRHNQSRSALILPAHQEIICKGTFLVYFVYGLFKKPDFLYTYQTLGSILLCYTQF